MKLQNRLKLYVVSAIDFPSKLMLARRMEELRIGGGTRLSYRSLKGEIDSSSLIVGKKSILNCRISFDRSGSRAEIGDRTYIGRSDIVVAEKVSIGSDVLISWGVTIVDHDSHNVDWQLRKDDVVDWNLGHKNWSNVRISPVNVCDKAWIGFGATILRGVTIGDGAVIGAKSVVTKSIDPWCVAVGSPARVIKRLVPPT